MKTSKSPKMKKKIIEDLKDENVLQNINLIQDLLSRN